MARLTHGARDFGGAVGASVLGGKPVGWLTLPAAVLFIVCVPICLVANNVRWVTLDPATYQRGFEQHGAAQRTGLDAQQLSNIARAFIGYFEEAPAGRLNPVVRLNGAEQPLFNEREIAHMQDVQQLIHMVFRLGLLSGMYLVAFMVGLLAWRGRAGLAALGRLAACGSGLSIALLLLVSFLSFVDFGDLFVHFHQLSFSNDLWILDPNRDYLLMLFPEGFWLDLTLRIAALTALEALVLGAAGLFVAARWAAITSTRGQAEPAFG